MHQIHPHLAPEIRSLLASLRRRIRVYVLLEGLALATIWLALTFWAGMAADYLPVLAGANEMPRVARGVLLAAIALVLGWIFYYWILRRTFVRMRDQSMALLLERRFTEFQDSLLTIVDLQDTQEQDAAYDPELLEQTYNQARGQLGHVRLGRVFNWTPLGWKLAAAAALMISIGLFYSANAEAVELWARRLYLLDDQAWPRRAYIEVVGAEVSQGVAGSESERMRWMPFREGVLKVAKGSSVRLRVRADADRAVIPEVCTIQYQTEDESRGRVPMQRIGRVQDGHQNYAFEGKPFRGILSSVSFDVVGYDHRVDGYRVEVVENPAIIATRVDCEFPAYLADREQGRWLPRENVAWSPGMQLPLGTKVTLRMRSNKPLQSAQILDLVTGESTTVQLEESAEGQQQIVYEVPQLESNLQLEIVLHDTDDVVSQHPHRVFIAAVPDEPPTVNMVVQGVREAITPEAIVPVQGSIRDDYGVAEAWFEVQVGEDPPRRYPLPTASGENLQAALDLREEHQKPGGLQLQPEQKIVLTVKATDRYALGSAPNLGSGDAKQFDVVTPDQLLVRLEQRELALRRRFEQIIEEMQMMRESLVRIRPDEQPTAPSEPGESANPASSAESPEERIASLQRMLAQRALLQSEKSASETAGVAAGFRDIREELINNRVDTEDRKERLQAQIAEPLERISTEMFPELDSRLKALERQLREASSAEGLPPVIEQADVILAEMQAVLQKMLELESYNELVDLLRSLLEDQERLLEETQKQRKEDILDLLK